MSPYRNYINNSILEAHRSLVPQSFGQVCPWLDFLAFCWTLWCRTYMCIRRMLRCLKHQQGCFGGVFFFLFWQEAVTFNIFVLYLSGKRKLQGGFESFALTHPPALLHMLFQCALLNVPSMTGLCKWWEIIEWLTWIPTVSQGAWRRLCYIAQPALWRLPELEELLSFKSSGLKSKIQWFQKCLCGLSGVDTKQPVWLDITQSRNRFLFLVAF